MRNYKPSEFVSGMLHTDVIHNKVEKKVCRLCNQQKQKEDFSRNLRSPDGRYHECKTCIGKRASKKYFDKKKDKELLNAMLPI